MKSQTVVAEKYKQGIVDQVTFVVHAPNIAYVVVGGLPGLEILV